MLKSNRRIFTRT